MAPITWTDVVALPGAVGDGMGLVPPLGQTMILASVNKFFDVTMYDGEDGPDTKLARCYMACHFAALGKLGSGGTMIGESDGRLSRQYAMPATRSEWFRTSYGAAAWSLANPRSRCPGVL